MFGRVVLEVLKHYPSKLREIHIRRNSFTPKDLNFNNIIVASKNLVSASWRCCRTMKPIPRKEISLSIICLHIGETRKYKRVEILRELKISFFHWVTSFKQKFKQLFRFRQRNYPCENRVKKRWKECIGFYLLNKN